ncbi:glycosyltransferase [bacterium]|nr:glycosyltransferase [bacterium]
MTDQSSGPLVSVVIPAYNAEAFLRRAIQSALDQTWRPLEIIVVDDGSTDCTRARAAAFGDPVRVLYQENKGQPAATNRAIWESAGNIIALLDADDEWLPDRLKKTVRPLIDNAKVGLTYCRSAMVSEDGSEGLLGRRDEEYRVSGGIYPPPRISVPASTFRREVFDTCGFFEESLPCFNDFDMFLRAAEKYEVREIPETLVKVHAHGSSQRHRYDADVRINARLKVMARALARRPDLYDRDAALAGTLFACGIHALDGGRQSQAFRYFMASWFLVPRWAALRFGLGSLFRRA